MGKLHPNCECRDVAIPPGASSPEPACDPPAVVAALAPQDLPKLLGADVARLVRAGLVPVGETVRDDWSLVPLALLARRLRLTAEQLLSAGVDPAKVDR